MVNNEIVLAYLICALWSSTGDDGEPLIGTHSRYDLSHDAKKQAIEFVSDFLGLLKRDGVDWCVYWSEGQLGHDLWLTQNGHGAGFWDRYSLSNPDGYDMGRALTKWANTMKSVDPYIGGDGLIYFN